MALEPCLSAGAPHSWQYVHCVDVPDTLCGAEQLLGSEGSTGLQLCAALWQASLPLFQNLFGKKAMLPFLLGRGGSRLAQLLTERKLRRIPVSSNISVSGER